MAVRGSGPSRRSHTKSRKGCKTCKRRHIRCDESYPQCRNCTKHHVRCDYLDATTPDLESSISSARTSPTPAVGSEENLSSYYPSDASYASDFSYILPTEDQQQYGPDSHLIENIISMLNILDSKGATDLTAGLTFIRRHMTLTHAFPFVMDALKSVSASHNAWLTQDPAARELSIQHSTTALAGLHQAVGQFSKNNADAVLSATMILSYQSRDWLSWSSLVGGLTSITAAIDTWQQDSIYSDRVKQVNAQAAWKAGRKDVYFQPADRTIVFANIQVALTFLLSKLNDRPLEIHWTKQFLDLTQQLSAAPVAVTPEEQFNQMYLVRKWVLWLPVLLLQNGPIDVLSLAVIANLYGLALTLTTIFEVGAELLGAYTAPALQNVINRIRDVQGLGIGAFDSQALMEFPQTALEEFTAANTWLDTATPSIMQVPEISTYFSEDFDTPGNLSPAFTPGAFVPTHTRAASAASAFLEIPAPLTSHDHFGFGQTKSQWGTFPSPSFPTHDSFIEEQYLMTDNVLNRSTSDPFLGYTFPSEIWT